MYLSYGDIMFFPKSGSTQLAAHAYQFDYSDPVHQRASYFLTPPPLDGV